MAEATMTLTAGPPNGQSAPKARDRIEEAFDHAEHRSQVQGGHVRAIALTFVGVWLFFENTSWAVLYYDVILLVFGILGYMPVLLRARGRWLGWHRYVLISLDMSLIAFTILVPNPFFEGVLPAGQQLRWGNEAYVFILVAASVFSYSPRAVLWTGVMGAAGWTVGFIWILDQPGSYLAHITLDMVSWPPDRLFAFVGDPNRLDLVVHTKIVLLFILVSVVLAIAMGRIRDLVRRQSVAESERANLARYFSPNMVDELAESDEPLGTVRTQNVAVLFADIVGFTSASATEPPENVIRRLRQFHGHMEHAVFAHNGTLDKYLGDGLMATFGTPHTTPNDAANALACANAMIAAIGEWSAERKRRGDDPIRVVVGVHYGPVVLGDIGGENRLEYAVVGDTVNVAARLEELTRQLGVDVAVSAAAVEAARASLGSTNEVVDNLRVLGPRTLRGRPGELDVWTFAATTAESANVWGDP